MVRRRVEGWPLQLSSFLRERNSIPFFYGQNDCMLFVADVVSLLTGYDPAAAERGTYSTEEEAQAIIESNGGMEAFITSRLGVDSRFDILSAARGDAAMINTEFGFMAGVVDDSGTRIAVPISDRLTLVRFPLLKAACIWRY